MNLDKTKSLELDKDDSNNYQWGLLGLNPYRGFKTWS